MADDGIFGSPSKYRQLEHSRLPPFRQRNKSNQPNSQTKSHCDTLIYSYLPSFSIWPFGRFVSDTSDSNIKTKSGFRPSAFLSIRLTISNPRHLSRKPKAEFSIAQLLPATPIVIANQSCLETLCSVFHGVNTVRGQAFMLAEAHLADNLR